MAKLQEELRNKTYVSLPLLRVWIAKSNGGERPLGIPAIRDRVAQMAVLLIIGPIFEADLCREQYGFRPGRSAEMAIQKAYFHVTERGLSQIVDADLSDYFNTIPHGALVRCLSRRIVDGHMLSVIKQWLRVPVVEHTEDGERRTTEAADKNRGVPQGGPLSPMADAAGTALWHGVQTISQCLSLPDAGAVCHTHPLGSRAECEGLSF